MPRTIGSLAGAAVVLLAACGSDGSTTTAGTPVCSPTTTRAFTFSAAGVDPKAWCLLPSGVVTFVNADTVDHTVAVDAPCAATGAGLIPRNGGTLPVTFPATSQTCTFRDPTVAAADLPKFVGNVLVTTAPVNGGGGY